ncbi:DUF6019 family protein [Eubacterium multiforme]|uniref:Membrane protein YdjX (TVP38/TMEM64 family) n=1 Tax=Eubacterium multiforme TaxID=83339 RepID=A0ABT9UPR7_9FIRM|nr:DUF6019 family protein [Eubacterium multiforme]MDQ0148647.1 putative membrane protein YdjX (TVP38/TMEM64 family) [Eubacterium multiforme]
MIEYGPVFISLLTILTSLIGVVIFYYVIKLAVKNGINESKLGKFKNQDE